MNDIMLKRLKGTKLYGAKVLNKSLGGIMTGLSMADNVADKAAGLINTEDSEGYKNIFNTGVSSFIGNMFTPFGMFKTGLDVFNAGKHNKELKEKKEEEERLEKENKLMLDKEVLANFPVHGNEDVKSYYNAMGGRLQLGGHIGRNRLTRHLMTESRVPLSPVEATTGDFRRRRLDYINNEAAISREGHANPTVTTSDSVTTSPYDIANKYKFLSKMRIGETSNNNLVMKDGGKIEDSLEGYDVDKHNADYFKQRVTEIGYEAAQKEYKKVHNKRFTILEEDLD